MSEKPIGILSLVSTAGGIAGFTFARSLPSLLGGVGIGGLMAVAALRINDGLNYGLELAAATSAGLALPMLRRAVATRQPIPVVVSLLATASTGYYTKELVEQGQVPR